MAKKKKERFRPLVDCIARSSPSDSLARSGRVPVALDDPTSLPLSSSAADLGLPSERLVSSALTDWPPLLSRLIPPTNLDAILANSSSPSFGAAAAQPVLGPASPSDTLVLQDISINPQCQSPHSPKSKSPVHATSVRLTSASPTAPSHVVPDLPSPPPAVMKQWSSLFTNKPRNVGFFEPSRYEINYCNGVMHPPPEVIDAASSFWSDQLVGFFLDVAPRFGLVCSTVRWKWKLKGTVSVRSDNDIFFFDFSCPSDRQRVLESEPIVIDNKPLIVTKWSPSTDSIRDQVLSIPVWVQFTKIPSVFQSLVGLNWLANAIGDLVCFDANTVRRDRLGFARALIEVTPNKPLPSTLKVAPSPGHVAVVQVGYLWRPPICIRCQSFGHIADSCNHKETSPPMKVPLPKPPKCSWIPKSAHETTTHVDSPSKQQVPSNAFDDSAFQEAHVSSALDIPVQDNPVQHPSPKLSNLMSSGPPDLPETLASANDSESDSSTDVEWNDHDHVWTHISGMQYDPRLKRFFKFISDDTDDLRCLYYSPLNNNLVLTEEGLLGAHNRDLLSDDSWNHDGLYSVGPQESSAHIIQSLLEAEENEGSSGSDSS